MPPYREDIEFQAPTDVQVWFGRGNPLDYMGIVKVLSTTANGTVFPLFQLDACAMLCEFKYWTTADITGGTNFSLGLYNIDDISLEVKKDALATGIDLSTKIASDLMPNLVDGVFGTPLKDIPSVVTALGDNYEHTKNFWLCLVTNTKPTGAGNINITASWVNGKL